MLVENVLIRPRGDRDISISWTSETPEYRSWIYLNGKFVVGPFMADVKERMIVLPVPTDKTFKIEVHDFLDDEIIPNSIEESPLIKPLIAWNGVDTAVAYRIYHTIFDTGSIESLLLQMPPMGNRMEIDCPVKLEGKNGRWHSFRVETVDQFGNESQNDVIPYLAADFPPVPSLTISRDTDTGLLSFRIL